MGEHEDRTRMLLSPHSAPPTLRPHRVAAAPPAAPTPAAEPPSDSVVLTGTERLVLAVGLGLAALASFAPSAPAASVPTRTDSAVTSYERLQRLAFGRGAEAPRGEALRWLEHYARTDYGAEMVGRVLADYEGAIAKGWVDADGELTAEGEFAGYVPFRIRHTEGSAEAGPAEIRLPARFRKTFPHGGQAVHPPAIVHHEFGHTRYGRPAGPGDLRETPHGTRLSLEHEMLIVDEYENPVRVRDGFEPRYRYYDESGAGHACSVRHGCGP